MSLTITIYKGDDMALNRQNFDRWIKRHKYFAMALPIVVVLSVFFVVTSLESMSAKDTPTAKNGYNNTLPDQNNEMEVKQPNTLYKQSLKDSLERIREKGTIRNIVDSKKEKDSLEKILLELENFSMDDPLTGSGLQEGTGTNGTDLAPKTIDRQTEAQKQLEYRNMLLKARDERLARSQDYSAPYSSGTSEGASPAINIPASVYRNQFVLPGDRVTLILRESVSYNGHSFPKNTFVYATANIKGSRILLEVSNIDRVPMALTAKDQQDGNIGLHSQRAGELWSEFSLDIQDDALGATSEELADASQVPMVSTIASSFGSFFKKKRYRENDKVLLMNGHNLYLVSKQ